MLHLYLKPLSVRLEICKERSRKKAEESSVLKNETTKSTSCLSRHLSITCDGSDKARVSNSSEWEPSPATSLSAGVTECQVGRGLPENQLQHEVFTVEGEEGPEEAQGHHAELWDTTTLLLLPCMQIATHNK